MESIEGGSLDHLMTNAKVLFPCPLTTRLDRACLRGAYTRTGQPGATGTSSRENIMVTKEGIVNKVVDFGIARCGHVPHAAEHE